MNTNIVHVNINFVLSYTCSCTTSRQISCKVLVLYHMFLCPGGSGGGHGAGGGQGKFQEVVCAPFGSLYHPDSFGGHGGSGGGADPDNHCGVSSRQGGGSGGGIVQLYTDIETDISGDVIVDGDGSEGPRGAGGAGGSILIQTPTLKGRGQLLARGGSVSSDPTACYGGGGSGGRITIHYSDSSLFLGSAVAHGGASLYECGGAGTILWHDLATDSYKLVVDNHDLCERLSDSIEYETLDDLHQGQESFHTWLFDLDENTHSHRFDELHLGGKAHLALWRRNIDTFSQFVHVAKTLGDKSGIFHVGPNQVCRLCSKFNDMVFVTNSE